ncbi:toxin VasX [Orbus mooreae]|uniref:toxin VasX n=1 Tax=Orbus mooreae TaxID=3074107 RepID=UPI00370D11A4
MVNTKQHDHNTDDQFDNQILYNEAEKSSSLANGGCGVCQRMGFPLFLVRKAIIPKGYRGVNWSQNIINLGSNEKPLSDAYEYAYRTLRTGYVYILLQEQDKTYRYLAYEVTPSGVFRHKSIEDMVEHNIHEIPKKCHDKYDHIPGVFINIDRSRYSGIGYIGYSRRAWSQGALDKYRLAANNADMSQLQRFSVINLGEFGGPAPSPDALGAVSIPSVLKMTPPPSRCFPFNDFDPKPHGMSQASLARPKLMELELESQYMIYIDGEQTIKEALSTRQYVNDSVATAHKFNSFKGNALRSTLLYSSTTDLVSKLFHHAAELAHKNRVEISTVVIDDPFAIAEELSLQRRLYVDPIMNIMEKSAEDFNQKTAEIFKERIDGQQDLDRLDKLIKQAIYNYYDNYPEEAKQLYGNKDEVLPDTTLDEPSVDKPEVQLKKLTYFYDLHRETSSHYLQPYQDNQDYFAEKSFHLRKLVEMIENYKAQLTAYFENQEEYHYHRVFSYSEPASNGYSYQFDDSARYLARPDLYTEITISKEDNLRIRDAERAKPYNKYNTYFDVRIFKSKTEMSQEGQIALKKELDKLKDHIDEGKVKEFIQQDNLHFTGIANTIQHYSTDYFNYLGWLFGANKQGSPYLSNLTTFNQIPFWQIESDQNGSNNHLGYLQDFIGMIDFNVVGGVPLTEQYGVWDVLLSDQSSLFYQLFNTDSEHSLWSLLVKARLAQDNTPSLSKDEKTLDNAIAYVLKAFAPRLDKLFCEKKGRIISELYCILIKQAIAGVAQKRDQTNRKNTNQVISEQGMTLPAWPTDAAGNMDEKAFKTLLCESLMVFNKTYAQFGQVKVPMSQASTFIRHWSIRPRVFLENHDNNSLTLLTSITEQRKVGDGSYELSEKSAEEFTFDIFDMSNSVASELKWQGNELKLKQGELGFNSLAGIDKAYLDEYREFGKMNDTVESGMSALLNSISLMLSKMSLDDNLEKLAKAGDAQYGQKYKDNLYSEIRKGYLTITSQTLVVVSATSQAALKGAKLAAYLRNNRQVMRWVNKILKGGGANAGLALAKLGGGILGIMAIIDGFDTMSSGSSLVKEGESGAGWVLRICGGAQVVIAVIGMLQLFNLIAIAGPWAVGLAVLSVIFMILAYIFRDKSLDWVPIEYWANRTLFGQAYKNKKWPAYPPTLLGTGIATNDYLAAVQGLHCNIEFGEKPEMAYVNRMDYIQQTTTELEQAYQQFLTKMQQTTDENQKQYLALQWEAFVSERCELLVSDVKEIREQAKWIDDYNSNKNQSSELMLIKSRWQVNIWSRMKGLYVQMTLPNYDPQISKLEGVLHLSKNNQTMILNITNGNDYPNIKKTFGELSTVALRGENKAPITNVESTGNTEGVTKEEFYQAIEIPKKDTVTGLMVLATDDKGNPLPVLQKTTSHKITYKVAELYGDHEIYLKVKYWQTGKTKAVKDQDGNTSMTDLTPLVQEYHYQKD